MVEIIVFSIFEQKTVKGEIGFFNGLGDIRKIIFF